MAKKTLIKTDKNGTKYWGDCTCQRCGGRGGADVWRYTGFTCYECGGTGISRMQIWKEYTPEYEAKLEARRKAKAEKERRARVEELLSNLPKKYTEKGFGEDGKAYAVIGNTYAIKDELKATGARWTPNFGAWVFPTKPEGYETVEIDFTECYEINTEFGMIYWKDGVDGRELIKAKTPRENKSQYIGEEGDKVEIEVTFKTGFEFEMQITSWKTASGVKGIFTTEDGNTVTWKTQNAFQRDEDGAFFFKVKNEDGEKKYTKIERGAKLKIKATVKGHSEYKGEKQTELTRATITLG